MTETTTDDVLAVLRILSPAGSRPDVDTALDQADAVVEAGQVAVLSLEQALVEATPTTGTALVGGCSTAA